MVVLQGQISLHRLGKPGEIAPGVAFLASDAALHVNGAVIDVPGGRCEFVFP
jgi:NAD(P)-dependent dehydrogenase (short-subunit alcohol dehydrogenase family)